jgi:hypothetical protein
VYNAWRQHFNTNNFNQKANDSMTLETIVAAAVVVASRRGGFYGARFPAFLGRLLNELDVVDDIDNVTDLPSGMKEDEVVPFLSMPNTEWPEEFVEQWKDSDAQFANMIRTADKHNIDFEVLPNILSRTGDGDTMFLSGKCKDRVDCLWGLL